MASLNLAAAVGANVNPEFLNAFHPAGPVAARGQAPGLVARNDSSVPTVNIFLDNIEPDLEFAASIVDACVAETTYALHCTAGPAFYCDPDSPVSPTNNHKRPHY